MSSMPHAMTLAHALIADRVSTFTSMDPSATPAPPSQTAFSAVPPTPITALVAPTDTSLTPITPALNAKLSAPPVSALMYALPVPLDTPSFPDKVQDHVLPVPIPAPPAKAHPITASPALMATSRSHGSAREGNTLASGSSSMEAPLTS